LLHLRIESSKPCPSGKTWKADIDAAGIDQKDSEGRIAGFHSLRVTLGTRLDRIGLSVKDRMRIMRHTDATVSYDVYSDVRLVDLNASINRLPVFEADQAAAANGTDGQLLRNDRGKNRGKYQAKSCDVQGRKVSASVEANGAETLVEWDDKSSIDDDCRSVSECGREESNLHVLANTRT
jgi:hypothetical protein